MEAAAPLGFGALEILNPTAADPQVLEEQALARAASRGDHAAFAQLVRRCQGNVFGLCYRLLGERDAAGDAAQEAFVRAYSALASFDPAQRFDVWVMRIARNHCYDLLRRRGYQAESDDEATAAAVDHSPSVEEQLDLAQQTRNLEEALDALPPKDREILALYYVQRMKTREIAEIIGCAPGTIMARLFRAREKLRNMLTEEAA